MESPSAVPWRRAPGKSNSNSPGVPCFTPPPPISANVWSPKCAPFPSTPFQEPFYGGSPKSAQNHISPLALPTQNASPNVDVSNHQSSLGGQNGRAVPPPPPPPPPPPMPPMLLQNPNGAGWRNKSKQNGSPTEKSAPMHDENLLQGRGKNMDGINQQYASLPAKLHNTLSKDKKPFTYTPGGIDFSEIRSPNMQRRIGNHTRQVSPPPPPPPVPASNEHVLPHSRAPPPPPPPQPPSQPVASSRLNQMPVRLPFAGPQLLPKMPSPNTGNTTPRLYSAPGSAGPFSQISPNQQPIDKANFNDDSSSHNQWRDVNNEFQKSPNNPSHPDQRCSEARVMPQSRSFRVSDAGSNDTNDGPRQYGVQAVKDDQHQRHPIPSRAFHTLQKMTGEMDDQQPYTRQGEIDPRYRGPKIPSRSFKMLQEMTGEENNGTYVPSVLNNRGAKPSNRVLSRPAPVVSPPNGQPLPNSQYSDEAECYYPSTSVPASQQELEAEPKKYMGGKIPSRSFRMLQAMTAGENEPLPNDVDETPVEYPAQYGETRMYTGGHIPSRSFRILQAMTGEENSQIANGAQR